MRKALADGLVELAAADPRLIFLTADLGFQVFDAFKDRFPGRYINVGVAEAQMMCCAAGLALEGWRPVVYSIASFATGRAFEQVRVSIAYPGLPVVVVGAGGGYTYANSGVTHHAAEDLGLMSMLPGFTVVAPGDANEVRALLPQLARLPGPSYFRVGRYGEATFSVDAPAVVGQARLLQAGRRLLVLCTGDHANVVMDALKALREEGVEPTAYHFHTVKPLDVATLDAAADVEAVVVVEEHLPCGGLAAAVAAWHASRPRASRLVRLGPPDALALGNWKREDLRRRLGYDAPAVVAACRTLWNERPAPALARR